MCLSDDRLLSPHTAARDHPTSDRPPAASCRFTHHRTRQSVAEHQALVELLCHSIPIGEHRGSGLVQYVFWPPARRTRNRLHFRNRAPRRRPNNALHYRPVRVDGRPPYATLSIGHSDPAYDHFAKCSPCYQELRTIQQADAARLAAARRKRLVWAARSGPRDRDRRTNPNGG